MFEEENSKLERTLTSLLRPIARLMIANALPLARTVELMKRALVAHSGAIRPPIPIASGHP